MHLIEPLRVNYREWFVSGLKPNFDPLWGPGDESAYGSQVGVIAPVLLVARRRTFAPPPVQLLDLKPLLFVPPYSGHSAWMIYILTGRPPPSLLPLLLFERSVILLLCDLLPNLPPPPPAGLIVGDSQPIVRRASLCTAMPSLCGRHGGTQLMMTFIPYFRFLTRSSSTLAFCSDM